MTHQYPQLLLRDNLWDFTGKTPYKSEADFVRAVGEYYEEVHEYAEEIVRDDWRPEEEVLDAKSVYIKYFFTDSDDEIQWRTVEVFSDHEQTFTAGQLLYKIHNAVIEHLTDSSHPYFEGLEYVTVMDLGIPVYEMNLGS